MMDWHTHILPNMDDGSSSIEESIEMLLSEKQQGIDTVVLTPHFYAFREDEEAFLKRRGECLARLKEGMQDYEEQYPSSGAGGTSFPELLLGAEVYHFERMHRMNSLDAFAFGEKRYFLIEMPFDSWTSHDLDVVYMTATTGNVTPVMAHVDRYLKYKGNGERLKDLAEMGAILQINAEYLQGRWTRHKVHGMLKKYAVVFGSDCHNMTNRRPDWEPVKGVL